MIRNFWNEEWKIIQFDEKILKTKEFKLSNYGRILSIEGKNEVLRKKSFVNGYETISLKQEVNKK